MKLKNTGKPSRPPVNGGTYLAVCVYSIDIGEQLCKFENNSSYKEQVCIGFELMGMTYEDNGVQKPYDLGKTYAASRHQNSGIRKMINAWNGREMTDEEAENLDTNDLVGRPALVNVIVKENGFNDIQSVLQVPAGLPAPLATMPLIRFDMDPWDQAAFDALPDWAKDRIKKSTQYQKEHLPAETVTVQQPQQTVAGFQMPANISGVNLQTVMQQATYAQSQPTAVPNNGSVIPF